MRKRRETRDNNLAKLAWAVVHSRAPPRYESLVKAVTELRAFFPNKPDSWVYRAVYRCLLGVKRVGEKHWLVRGSKKLRDAYPYYNVWLREGRYHCDCHYRAWGRKRRKDVCTHVAAVILHRRQKMISEYV